MGNTESSSPPAQAADSGGGRGGLEEGAWEVQLAATEIIRMAGVAAYHTSVLVGGREYYFDNKGIATGPTLFSHSLGRPTGLKTEVIRIGRSVHNGCTMSQALSPFFNKGTYDIIHKNCNAFTDAALYFLTGTRLDSHYSRAERILLAMEPLSASVLNQLLKAASEASAAKSAAQGKPPAPGVRGYSVNPQARGFNVEDVVAALDDADDDESSVVDAAGVGRRAGGFFGLAASCCCVLSNQSKSTELVPATQRHQPALTSSSKGSHSERASSGEDQEDEETFIGVAPGQAAAATVLRQDSASSATPFLSKQLEVRVQRRGNEDKLGIDVTHGQGPLTIVAISSGSAVDRANEASKASTPPGDTLEVGDVITQVNGLHDVTTASWALVTECQQKLDLKLKATRQISHGV
jgi:hypothetical protein